MCPTGHTPPSAAPGGLHVNPWFSAKAQDDWNAKALKAMELVTLKPRSLADGMEDRGRPTGVKKGMELWHCARCDWEGYGWRLVGHWLKEHRFESVDLFLDDRKEFV